MFNIGEECLIKRNILTSKMDLLKLTHNCEKMRNYLWVIMNTSKVCEFAEKYIFLLRFFKFSTTGPK